MAREAALALLREVPVRLKARVHEILLAVLVGTLTEWTGGPALWADLGGHGREDLFAGLDLSRTVGWFTSTFPVYLEGGDSLATVLARTQARLRSVPNRGFGYGVLRYLSPDAGLRAALQAMPQPEVRFDYDGHLPALAGPGGTRLLSVAREARGPVRSLQAQREYVVDVSAWVSEEQIHVR